MLLNLVNSDIIASLWVCALWETFSKAKVNKLIGDIEGVKTYIDDILLLVKDSFENHIDHLIIIFGRLRAAGLKVNTPKCSFGLKDMHYLGYVITRKVIKPNPK